MRWKVVSSYDGTDFSGWQSQPDGRGIQDTLEQRLAHIFKQPVRIHGSGRTDAGVHARGQVFHFDADWPHGAPPLHEALQATLPETLRIEQVAAVEDSFHARFSAVGKRYDYFCLLGRADPMRTRYCWSCLWDEVDSGAIRSATQCLLGTHDFTAFGAMNGGTLGGNPVKTIWKCAFHERDGALDFRIEGSGFLYKMVRSLVGTLMNVGRGRLSPADFEAILKGQQRTPDVVTAPARGLFLSEVFYEPKAAHSDANTPSE